MMEKRFQAHSVESLQKQSVEQILGDLPDRSDKTFSFPKGTKFIFNDRVWFVVRAWTDSGVEWRKIMSSGGEEEVCTVYTLRKDMTEQNFLFDEPTPTEVLMMKARRDEA